MGAFVLTCNACSKKEIYLCSKDDVKLMSCVDCAKQGLEYIFSDNMTIGMIRPCIDSLNGDEKLERIKKDMRETFKLKEVSNKVDIKREADFKADLSPFGL